MSGTLCPFVPFQQLREDGQPEDAEVVADEAAEAVAVRVSRKPYTPTQQEVDQHLPLHEPYRSWCPICVAGRGVSDRHVWRQPDPGTVAVIGLDYGYLVPRAAVEDSCSPLLCGRDTLHKWSFGFALPCKGTAHPYCVKAVTAALARGGFARVCLRSDTEPAMVALRRAVGVRLTAEHGVEVMQENVSVGDSSGNGLAEDSVREVKAKARSLAHGVFKLLGVRLDANHKALPWLVQWAAITICIGRRGLDGKTAWERRYGKHVKD